METVFAVLLMLGTPALLVAGLVKPGLFGAGRKRAVLVALIFAVANFVGFGLVHEPPEKTAATGDNAERVAVAQQLPPVVPVAAPGRVQSVPAPQVAQAASMPSEHQRRLSAIVEQYAGHFQNAPNEMARGAWRPERAAVICQAFPNGVARDWLGEIATLSSTNDGNGVLTVRVAPQVSLATNNNALSEAVTGSATLISAGSPLHQQVARMRVGQKVWVNGRFVSDGTDCFKELSLTVRGAMRDPTYLFRFTDVRPAE